MKHLYKLITVAAMASLACAQASAQNGYDPSMDKFVLRPKERIICVDSGGIKEVKASPNGQKIAVMEADASGMRMIVDGNYQPKYSGIAPGTFAFSADGGHYAYAVDKGFSSILIVDGKEALVANEINANSVIMSDDGSSYACACREGLEYNVYFNREKGPSFKALLNRPPVLSPDGRHIAYVGGDGEKWGFVLDQKLKAAYDAVSNITFSSDGNHIAYCAKDGSDSYVVLDGKPQMRVDFVGRFLFSSDSMHNAYLVGIAGKYNIVRDGRIENPFDEIAALVFSKDSQHLVYQAKLNGQWMLVIDGKADELRFDAVGDLAMNKNIGLVAYPAQTSDKKWHLVINGKIGPECDGITNAIVSENADTVGCVVKNERKESVFINGMVFPKFDEIGHLSISKDGKHFAYSCRSKNKWRVIYDNRLSSAIDSVIANGPTLTDNGALNVFVKDGKNLVQYTKQPEINE